MTRPRIEDCTPDLHSQEAGVGVEEDNTQVVAVAAVVASGKLVCGLRVCITLHTGGGGGGGGGGGDGGGARIDIRYVL